MSRSPLSYPLNRGADIDGGGVADLQTDVMRFMAILCLCLVAIFALVQSVPVSGPTLPAPLPPADLPVVAAPPQAAPQASPAEHAEKPQEPTTEARPRSAAPPMRPDAVREFRAVRDAQAPDTRQSPAAAEPVTAQPSTSADGFTLRFESDNSLKALVAREEIGLYAISGDSARRLAVEHGRLQFWQASLPSRFHEMDSATVPADVVLALGRSGSIDATRWGVTLPPGLSRQLNRYLEDGTGGELIIAGDGRMRRE